MRLADLDVFDQRQLVWFERLFAAAILANVATEAASGLWAVHRGKLYPWRHLPILPLWSTTTLAIVWSLLVLSGALVALGSFGRFRRFSGVGFRLAAPLLFLSVVEHYSNHGALLFLVAFYVALAPPSSAAPPPAAELSHLPNMGLVRAQLLLVYVFGAVNKVVHDFANGQSLVNLFGWSEGFARAASVAVIAAELVLPVLLVVRPKLGLLGVLLLHLAFAAAMPGLWSFGLAMVAMAVLFLPKPPPDYRSGPISDASRVS